MPFGGGKKIVVQHVPAIIDRHRKNLVPFLPDSTKPTSSWAAARSDRIAFFDVAAWNELKAVVSISDPADFDRSDVLPLFGQSFSFRLVPSERNRDVHLVGFRKKIWRANVGKFVIWSC